MKRGGFTLLELLLVIGIMAFMGAMAVGGYQTMRRGMENRSVMQSVNHFIRAAYQRAQIDRQPVAVYFWNETQRVDSPTEPPIAVGKAVAVRRAGRFTRVIGDYLIDEFGDLRFNRLILSADEEDEDSGNTGSSGKGNGVFVYPMNGDEGNQVKRTTVDEMTVKKPDTAFIDGRQVSIDTYAYYVQNPGGIQWKAGDAYGFEFADLTLPNNYIFGKDWSRNISSPVKGESIMRFNVSSGGSAVSSGTGDTIEVANLRQASGGSYSAKKVAVSDSPTKQLEN
ncbi:MAG: type II secretion system GspH family protein [Kiritimatiellae bacterium]|nr:type II secretion system GspH family protein [Kiritimatiellia bacterium]